MLEKALKLIREQQAVVGKNTLAYDIGALLAGLCQVDQTMARIVAEDMETQKDALKKIGEKMTATARKKCKGNSYYMGQAESERIIQEHFGMKENTPRSAPMTATTLNLLDFM